MAMMVLPSAMTMDAAFGLGRNCFRAISSSLRIRRRLLDFGGGGLGRSRSLLRISGRSLGSGSRRVSLLRGVLGSLCRVRL